MAKALFATGKINNLLNGIKLTVGKIKRRPGPRSRHLEQVLSAARCRRPEGHGDR